MGMQISNYVPNRPVKQLFYFIKIGHAAIHSMNFDKEVQFGSMCGGYLESLLRVMSGVYSPIFFQNLWPDSIKNDFSAQLHKFLGGLTDTRWKLEGKTILYVPLEGIDLEIKEAAKQKELVQRYETAMIHWATQVKEVLSTQDSLEVRI